MIDALGFTAVGAGLFALFFVIRRMSSRGKEDSLIAGPVGVSAIRSELDPCPQEVVARLFALEDWQFIGQGNARLLRKSFIRERSALAIGWLRRTSAEIGRAMRDHLSASGRSRDLRVLVEIRILLEFIFLLFLCRLLILLVQCFGPFALRGSAIYANKLYQRLSDTVHVDSCAPVVSEVIVSEPR